MLHPSIWQTFLAAVKHFQKIVFMQINRRVAIRQLATFTLGWSVAQLSASNCRLLATNFQDERGYEAKFPSMGSEINLRWFSAHPNQHHIVETASQIADKWVAILSDYEPTSQTMVACSSADSGNWVPVSNELWSIVHMCDQWHNWSNGAFDAALGALTRLRRQRKKATDGQWEEARLKSGWKFLELDASKQAIRFTVPGVRFDFGAIGKGFVVDRIAEKLVEMGIERYVVNASGNMRIGKAPQESLGWPIAIDIPAIDENESSVELFRMRISQCGIATSGDRWQRFPDAPGDAKKDYSSHIVDPVTNTGISGRQSVTIIAENAADADAAATATCVRANRDLAEWLKVLSEQKPKMQAHILLRKDNEASVRYLSSGN
jgi:FAD:protein FMN transferase